MNASVEAKDIYLHAHAESARNLAGHKLPWVAQTRERALTQFAEQGFPTIRDEEWRYTNVAPIQRGAFHPAPKDLAGLTERRLQPFLFQDLSCHRLVFVNGYFAPQLSLLGKLPDGVTLSSLATAIDSDAVFLQRHLARYAPIDRYGFAALNTAFLSDGACIYLPRGVKLADPVHLLFVSTARDEPALVQPRNLIVTEANSRAVLIESYISFDEARYFTNAISELVIAENATIEHYKLVQESAKAYHVGGIHVRQHANSRFISHNITVDGALVRNDIDVLFEAEGGECVLNGLYLASNRQHIDNHTRLDHAQPNCNSREFYKGVLDGRARAVFNGRIIVRQDAQHTDAQQENKNLLLSRDAEVDTKPQLEIYADDVKCAHGATVGQLDDDALYYLRSRGIDVATARHLLTYAFAKDVLNRIALEAIRGYVEKMLSARLLQGRTVETLA
jgi:Fe-S cluster assembly protein SufD